jgi:hypothetical protein
VGELHTFRRAGRARRVDEGEDVFGLHGLPGGVEVEAGVGPGLDVLQRDGAGRLPVDAHDVLDLAPAGGGDPFDEGAFADHDPVLGVGEQVGDLLGGQGVVDRERRGAQVHRGGVAEVELRTVRHHERHGVAALHSQPGQAGGDAPDPFGVLPPGDLDRAAGRAQRHPARIDGGRPLEGLTQRRDTKAAAHALPLRR